MFSKKVAEILSEVEKVLVEKNKKYGNAALEPVRIFSKASAIEQLLVRIDDKLSRVANQQAGEDEDVTLDLIGYLVLLRIAEHKPKVASSEDRIFVEQNTDIENILRNTPWFMLTRFTTGGLKVSKRDLSSARTFRTIEEFYVWASENNYGTANEA